MYKRQEQASDEGFVKASDVLCGQTVENRDAALALISERAVEAGIAEDSAALYAAFLKREAEGTTGMVEGFAIPHAKSDTVKTAQVMVLKSSEGIASWETMDGSPVTCAIALLVPESEAGTSHLQILSKVATALTDEAVSYTHLVIGAGRSHRGATAVSSVVCSEPDATTESPELPAEEGI